MHLPYLREASYKADYGMNTFLFIYSFAQQQENLVKLNFAAFISIKFRARAIFSATLHLKRSNLLISKINASIK